MKRSLISSIGPQIERFLEFKRSQGYKYDTAEYYLSNLDDYWATNGYDNNFSKEHINGWFIRGVHESPDTHNFRISYLREFGRFLQSQGYRNAFVIPTGLSKRGPKYMPYLLSEDRIEKFFEACDRITPQKENLGKPLVLPLYFRFLYCCGVRTGEARLLKTDDVNLVQGYADIINTKGGKCRRLFLSNELIQLLDHFDSKISIYYPSRTYFFPCNDNDPYSSQAISRAFNKLWSDAGLPAECKPKPRAYDFSYPYINKIRTFRKEPDIQRKIQEKGSDNNFTSSSFGHRSTRTNCHLHYATSWVRIYRFHLRAWPMPLPPAR